jgi:short-subunit dehydrogenase
VKDQHVVLTGASAGIGMALAHALAARGCKLTLVARRRDKLEQLAAALSVPTHIVEHDLSVPSQAASFLPAAIAALGPVDVLVNNAGLQVVGRTHLVDIEAAERSMATNLLSPLRLVHAVLPSMIARDAGTIVNISSMAALAPTPGMTWYNASKAGLAAASEALRGELRETHLRIVTVYPGIIPETDMARAALDKYHGENNFVVRIQPTGTPGGLASVVLRAMERGTARVIWPRANALARHFPAATRWVMDKLTPLPETARS